MGNTLQELARRYLEKLYELSEGGLHPEVDYWKVKSELGFSSDETRAAVDYLLSKDLVTNECRVPCIRITIRGIDAVQQSYSEKETCVLKKIYDLSEQNTAKPVFVHQLESELGMGWQELDGFCKGLKELDYVDWPADVEAYLFITRRGIEAIQSLGKPKSGTGDTYHTHIGSVTGGVHVGPGGVQKINTNEPISEILPALEKLITAVRGEDFPDKDDVLRDLEIAQQVALANPNATVKDGAWTRILTKLNAAKTTMELAGFVVKTYPYWPQVIDFFSRHIQ
ncbi:MAG: hypothetical protein ABJB21_11290 [bacterium]